MTAEQPYDIWVDFNDIGPTGRVVTYADMARDGVNLAVGAHLTAGDGEGSRCPATVVSRQRSPLLWWRPARLVLQLDLDRFEDAEGP